MSFGEFGRMLARWKSLVVPGALLAIVAAAALFYFGKPEYTRTESYLLLSPVQTKNGPENPYLSLGGGLAMTTGVLVAKTSDGGGLQRLALNNPGLSYTIGPDSTIAAPLIRVSVTATDAAALDEGLRVIGSQLTADLDSLQADSGAPKDSWVTIKQVTQDQVPVVSHSKQLRNALGGLIACAGLVLAAVILAERRSRRRQRGAGSALGGSPTVSGSGRHSDVILDAPVHPADLLTQVQRAEQATASEDEPFGMASLPSRASTTR